MCCIFSTSSVPPCAFTPPPHCLNASARSCIFHARTGHALAKGIGGTGLFFSPLTQLRMPYGTYHSVVEDECMRSCVRGEVHFKKKMHCKYNAITRKMQLIHAEGPGATHPSCCSSASLHLHSFLRWIGTA